MMQGRLFVLSRGNGISYGPSTLRLSPQELRKTEFLKYKQISSRPWGRKISWGKWKCKPSKVRLINLVRLKSERLFIKRGNKVKRRTTNGIKMFATRRSARGFVSRICKERSTRKGKQLNKTGQKTWTEEEMYMARQHVKSCLNSSVTKTQVLVTIIRVIPAILAKLLKNWQPQVLERMWVTRTRKCHGSIICNHFEKRLSHGIEYLSAYPTKPRSLCCVHTQARTLARVVRRRAQDARDGRVHNTQLHAWEYRRYVHAHVYVHTCDLSRQGSDEQFQVELVSSRKTPGVTGDTSVLGRGASQERRVWCFLSYVDLRRAFWETKEHIKYIFKWTFVKQKKGGQDENQEGGSPTRC